MLLIYVTYILILRTATPIFLPVTKQLYDAQTEKKLMAENLRPG